MRETILKPALAGRMTQASSEIQQAFNQGQSGQALEATLVSVANNHQLTKVGLAEAAEDAYEKAGANKIAPEAAARALRGAMAKVGERAEHRIGQLFRDVMTRDTYDDAAAIETKSAGKKDLRTEKGTAISYPEEYPAEQTRYFMVRPELAVGVADALSIKISGFFKSDQTPDRRLPIHIREIEVNGKPVALLSSGDPKFYFGAGELSTVQSFGALLIDLDMRNLDKEQRGFFAGSRADLERLAAKL